MIYTLKIFYRDDADPLIFTLNTLGEVCQTIEDTLESSVDHYNIVRMEVTWE